MPNAEHAAYRHAALSVFGPQQQSGNKKKVTQEYSTNILGRADSSAIYRARDAPAMFCMQRCRSIYTKNMMYCRQKRCRSIYTKNMICNGQKRCRWIYTKNMTRTEMV